jgi:hypothetical protein
MGTDGAAEDPLTISESARACGVHRNTVRRYLDSGRFPNAFHDGDRSPWMIPREDLVGAGLSIVADPHPGEIAGPNGTPEVTGEVEELRRRVQEMARRAEVAEALAAERQARIEDLRRALDLLHSSRR